jgi:hypothetical protein
MKIYDVSGDHAACCSLRVRVLHVGHPLILPLLPAVESGRQIQFGIASDQSDSDWWDNASLPPRRKSTH